MSFALSLRHLAVHAATFPRSAILPVVTPVHTWRLGARALGAAVELHYLSAPVDVLFERLERRGRENPPIERDALSRWVEVFQVPTVEEMMLFDEPLVDLQHPE